MTRARELARLGNTNVLTIDSDNNLGVGTATPDRKLDVGTGDLIVGAAITLGGSSGIISATSFKGSITGPSGTFSGNVTIGGTLTYDDVTNIDSVGVITAQGGVKVTGGEGIKIDSGGLNVTAGLSTFAGNLLGASGTNAVQVGTALSVAGIGTFGSKIRVAQVGASGTSLHVHGDTRITGVITATKFLGDGSELTGVVSGIEVKSSGSSVGTSLTAINFSGATASTGAAGITTVTIAAAGLETSSYTASGITTYLLLGDAQDHKLTASGLTTVTCYGGTEGESHTLRIVNSGVSTVGFSTYFLWPSGASPVLPTTSGAISLVSFTIQRVGAAGTQLLSGASLNFSY